MLRTAALLVLLPVAGGSAGAAKGGPRTHTVTMDQVRFGAVAAGLKVGDTVVWDNRDIVPHTATARDGSFDVRLQPGKTGRTVLKKAGNIAIYCIYHPMMRATLRVAG